MANTTGQKVIDKTYPRGSGKRSKPIGTRATKRQFPLAKRGKYAFTKPGLNVPQKKR